MLLGLANDVDRLGDVKALAGDPDRGVDFGDLPFGELAVDGRPGDLNDVADNLCVG